MSQITLNQMPSCIAEWISGCSVGAGSQSDGWRAPCTKSVWSWSLCQYGDVWLDVWSGTSEPVSTISVNLPRGKGGGGGETQGLTTLLSDVLWHSAHRLLLRSNKSTWKYDVIFLVVPTWGEVCRIWDLWLKISLMKRARHFRSWYRNKVERELPKSLNRH